MKAHLHVDLQKFFPIGWADTQESIVTDYRQKGSFSILLHPDRTTRNIAMASIERHISSKCSPGMKPLGATYLQSIATSAMRCAAPPPGSSLACHSLHGFHQYKYRILSIGLCLIQTGTTIIFPFLFVPCFFLLPYCSKTLSTILTKVVVDLYL